MKKVLILAFISVLLLVSFASATTTEVNVKTLENHQVYISIQNPETNGLITDGVSSKIVDSGSEGKVTTSLDTGALSKINVIINVKKDGQKVIGYKYSEHTNGQTLYLCIDKEDTDDDCESAFAVVEETPIENETSNETVASDTSTESTETEESSGALTGFTSFVKDTFTNATTYYILGAIVVVILGFFLLRKAMPYIKNRQSSQSFYAPQKSEKAENISSGKILEVERKLQAAQAELNRLKNQDRISLVEKKLQRDKEELERMKRGD